MFAVICDSEYFKEIKAFCSYQEIPIIHKCIGDKIEVNKINEVNQENKEQLILIVQLDIIVDQEQLARIIAQVTAKQVLILVEHEKYREDILKELIENGIYDIIEIDDVENLQDNLLDHITHPSSKRKAEKWLSIEEKETKKNDDKSESNEVQNYISSIYEYIEDDISKEENVDKAVETKEEEYEDEYEDERGVKKFFTIQPREVIEKEVVVIKEKIVGSIVVALAGTQHRIGVTHTSISLAIFLSKKGYDVALVEEAEEPCFDEIEKAYKDVKTIDKGYVLDGITFYKKTYMTEILQKKHNFIILDMGIYQEGKEEFKRATKKILISGSKDWEFKYLETVLQSTEKLYLDQYTYYFNFCDQDTLNFIKQNMTGEILKIGYNPNPFELTEDATVSFEQLMKELLPEVKKKKKFANIFRN